MKKKGTFGSCLLIQCYATSVDYWTRALPLFDIHEVHTESIQIQSNFERAQPKEGICYLISEVSSKSTSLINY